MGCEAFSRPSMYESKCQTRSGHCSRPAIPREQRPLVRLERPVEPECTLSFAKTQCDAAPKSIDHIHDVLSAVLRTAVKWGHLQENPARGVDLPTLRCVRPRWALTTGQAASLVTALPRLPQTMVGLAILSGLRRGEIFALRWKDIDENGRLLTVREASTMAHSAYRKRKRDLGRFRFQSRRYIYW